MPAESCFPVVAPPTHLTTEQVQFFDEHCEAIADRFIDYASRVGLLDLGPDGRRFVEYLHPGAWVEIAAFLQLEDWDRAGLAALLADLLPEFVIARQRMIERCTVGDLASGRSPRLCWSWRVASVLVERLAVAGPGILGAEIVLGASDEDALIDTVAQLIWEHRHDPSHQR